jgi:hypothetical protein
VGLLSLIAMRQDYMITIMAPQKYLPISAVRTRIGYPSGSKAQDLHLGAALHRLLGPCQDPLGSDLGRFGLGSYQDNYQISFKNSSKVRRS